MNGIIVVNKEKGMTSHDVVGKIRKIFNTKQVGHLGTLDPLATGVLAVCINNATKLVQFLSEHDKTYVATVCIGKSTDTYDLEGKIIEESAIKNIDVKFLDEILNSFIGESYQIPPMYSSIKVNGKKLYEYARNGEKIEVEPRKINIYSLKRISDIKYDNNCGYFDIEVSVSKGTYIRSLCYDIGRKLHLPSLMAKLNRIELGIFSLSDSYTLAEIEDGKYRLYSNLEALSEYKMIDDEKLIIKAKQGMKISINDILNIIGSKEKRIVIKDGLDLIAIYDLDLEKKCYKAVRVWN